MIQTEKTGALATSNDQFVLFDARGNGGGKVSPTITGNHNNSVSDYSSIVLESMAYGLGRDSFNMGQNAKFGMSIDEEVQPPMTAKGPGGVAIIRPYYIVRRLTPTECARLQGMPDWWCADVLHKDSVEYKMWGNGMALPNVLYVMEGIRLTDLMEE